MRVLLIDDDKNLCRVLAYQLSKNGFDVVTAHNGTEGLKEFMQRSFEIVLTDIRMPDLSGIEVLKRIRSRDREVVVIIITAHGSVDNAIEACRLGADDYITKPFGQEQLLFVIEKAVRIRKLQQENVQLKRTLVEKYRFDQIVAKSSKMQDVLKMAMQVANSDATVLIQGESGTGKELIAQVIHYNSPRQDKPLITVNCPSIPDNLLESELFGHVRGAFTGAIKDRKGKFELANGGTLFLDEIGDLKDELQAKLLRVLQEGEIERVGENKTIAIDVRIVAATNKNLARLIERGSFRQDLYYRLSVIPITIPPLRERKEDIPYLIDFFLDRYGKGKRYEMEPKLIEALQEYDWPGNIRELENLIERMIVLSSSQTIRLKDLPASLVYKIPAASSVDTLSENPLTLEQAEKQAIIRALNEVDGNQTRAAELLNVPRHVLLYRMKKLGIKNKKR